MAGEEWVFVGSSLMNAADTGLAGGTHAGAWAVTTHWSVVLSAANSGSANAAEALESLCRTYWYPLYAYLRRRGHNVDEAQDLTQEFFARLLEKHWLEQADPNRGKFRSCLLGAMNHFAANEWRRAHAAKRGGMKPLLSLDDTAESRYALEPSSELTPERLYDRRWALSLFESALARLREDYRSVGKAELFESLKDFLSAEPADGDYARVGASFGMSNGAVAAAVHRLRQHYRQLVHQEVAHTLANPADVEDEMRALLEALG